MAACAILRVSPHHRVMRHSFPGCHAPRKQPAPPSPSRNFSTRRLIECAKEADATINEREYGPGKHPSDAECTRVVGYTREGEVTRAMELGMMKHAEAFACVQRRLLTKFPDHISLEPRYSADSITGRYMLTDRWAGSIKPDIVLHLARNPNKVRCVYDFKFPCTLANKREPLSMRGVEQQLLQYDSLGGNCPSAIVTPQLGINP